MNEQNRRRNPGTVIPKLIDILYQQNNNSYSGFGCLKIWFARGLLHWSYQNWIICTETVTRAFWNNVKDFFFSVDLMEAFGVIETNKCLGLTGKEGNMLVSRCLFLVRFYILSCQYKNLKPSIVEYRQLYHWIRNLIETEIFEGRWEKIFRKGIYSSELSFFPPCFLKEIQYEQIPKDKRKYFFYVISCPATLLSIC